MKHLFAVALVMACGSKSAAPTGGSAAAPVPIPSVGNDGVLAIDDGKPPPVVVIVDGNQQVSIASVDSWAKLATWTLSAGPKKVENAEDMWKFLREVNDLGLKPREAVKTYDGAPRDLQALDTKPGSDDQEESGGTGTAMALDEGKMGKQAPPPDPDAELHRFGGMQGSLIFGYSEPEPSTEPQRLANVIGEVPRDHQPDPKARAVLAIAPTNRASVLVDAVANSGGMILVERAGAVKALRVHFSTRRDSAIAEEPRWLEVRIGAAGLDVEAVPGSITSVPWTTGALDAKQLTAALAAARGSTINPLSPVDVLASAETNVQRMVDVVAALDAAGVRMIGIGPAPKPDGEQAKMRGHRPPPSLVFGVPNVQGDLDKPKIREALEKGSDAMLACYHTLLAKVPDAKATVLVNFTIAPTGKVTTTEASNAEATLAACVAEVVKQTTFPKPGGGMTVEVSYPFGFRP